MQQPMTSASVTQPDRGTSFVAVEGGKETRNGGALLITAYALIWVVLMVWLGALWKKQVGLNARVDGLEKAIDRAAKTTTTADAASRPSDL